MAARTAFFRMTTIERFSIHIGHEKPNPLSNFDYEFQEFHNSQKSCAQYNFGCKNQRCAPILTYLLVVLLLSGVTAQPNVLNQSMNTYIETLCQSCQTRIMNSEQGCQAKTQERTAGTQTKVKKGWK